MGGTCALPSAAAQGREIDPYAVMSALQFRHASVDGRLGHWTAAVVRDFLLSYVPRTLSATAEEAVFVPETLRLFLRYLDENGLAGPWANRCPISKLPSRRRRRSFLSRWPTNAISASPSTG